MNKRHYEHTLPNIRGSLSNTYEIKQSFNISRLQYGNKESYMAGLIESNK